MNFSKFIFSLILLSIFSFPVFASNFGSGTDGSVTLSTSVNINTQSLGSSSDLNGSTADGVVYRVSNISGSTITTAQNATGILANDLILLINLQGTASNYSSVGNYEILTVNSVSGTTVNLTSSVSLNYVNGDSYSNQKVIIQRIPQYSSLTINNGGVITASTFDSLGTLSSGIVAFAVNGNLTINSGGLINVAGKGFQGGAGISGTGTQGSSYNGNGSRTNTALGGGGGGGISHYYNNGITSGGGGGGYAIAGSNGIYGSGFATSAPGTGGGTYGNASLTKIYLGSGGGGGASYSDSSDSPGGNGANGGGVVLIMANSVNMVGGIYAIGNTGETGGNSWNAGGGGGAGGSIFIKCQSASLGSSNVIAYGGPGGAGRGGAGGGGAGGTGRIAVQYSSSVSGTTNPAATTNQIDITPPSFSSITNSSSTWYSSARNSVITASDSGGSGLAEIRYNWGSNTMNSACNSGGTVISSGGTTASSPVGNQTLYVCARDTAGNVTSTSQANYKWENTPPSTPTPATTSNSVSGYIKGSFTVDAPSGSSDTGGSGLASYSIWKCDDNLLTINCIVIASGISGSTVSISGSYLPSEGNSMYYYWRSIDSAGNTSGNSSPLGLTMDSTAPTTSVTIANSKYDSSNWVASNTINGTANDAVSTLNKVEITIQRNSDSTYWTGSSWGGLTWLSVIGTTTWTYPMDNLNLDENVTYEVKARATDIATNTTSTGLGVDTFLYELYIPPTPTPTNTPVPTDTPTPTPTNTPVPSNTPTPTPTETPVPTLTNTPVPTLSPIPGWSTIHNVNSGIVPVLITDWNTNLETTAQTGITTVGVEDTVNANIKVAEMPVNFGSSPDWSGVTGATDENIAYFHSTQSISTITNGAASSYSLYIRKGEGDKVLICPGATSLSEVTLTCFGGYYLSEGETKNGATATVITNGVQYWKVSGLTSTGGMSVLTGLKDILSRLQVSEPSDHKINFNTTNGMIVGSTDTMVLSFPDFDLSSIILNDIELTDSIGSARNLASSASDSTWGVIINSTAKTITFSVPTSGTGGYDAPSQIAIKIGINAGGTNQIVNPASVGNTSIGITLNNTAPGENGDVTIPIIDSDTITITAYVTAYLSFDIDTGVGEIPGVNPIINCEFDTCLTHQNGDPGTNYTVDLGELTSSVVNKSNDTSVAHSSGGNGIVNSIYFDISTNAPSGAVVAVTSANGGLKGPGVNKIPSIGIQAGADGIVRFDGDDIPANSGVYGYTLPVASSQVYGSIIKNTLCDSAFKYCGADTIIPKTVFTTNNLPVDTARVRLDLAAAANYTNNPGLYTDTLTFIATATF